MSDQEVAAKIETRPMVRPTFERMVNDLFKLMPGHGAAMLHGAVGIAGETGELRNANSKDELIEEAGDLEFYIEACWQQVTKCDRMQMVKDFDILRSELLVAVATLGTVMDNIHLLGCEILDHAKKVWVYEDGNRDERIGKALCMLEYNLLKLYEYHGLSRAQIKTANQDKLLGNEKIRGRYESGVYSNEAALARVDKTPERKFMSDTKSSN